MPPAKFQSSFVTLLICMLLTLEELQGSYLCYTSVENVYREYACDLTTNITVANMTPSSFCPVLLMCPYAELNTTLTTTSATTATTTATTTLTTTTTTTTPTTTTTTTTTTPTTTTTTTTTIETSKTTSYTTTNTATTPSTSTLESSSTSESTTTAFPLAANMIEYPIEQANQPINQPDFLEIPVAGCPSEDTAVLSINPSPTTYVQCQELNHNPCFSSPCKNGGSCYYYSGSSLDFRCACQPGYKDSLCSTEENKCESYPCEPFGQCNDLGPNNYTCSCLPGFTSAYGNDTFCQDIDECRQNLSRCSPQSWCMNLPGRYQCICPPGKVGLFCEMDLPTLTPRVTSVSRTYGLMAGGGLLYFGGQNLKAYPLLGAYFVPSDQKNQATLYGVAVDIKDNRSVAIKVPRLKEESFLNSTFDITLEYSGQRNISTDLKYRYIANPIVTDILPKTLLALGGISLTVVGDYMDGVDQPLLLAVVKTTLHGVTNVSQPTYTECRGCNESSIVCYLPDIEVPDELKFTNNSNISQVVRGKRDTQSEVSPRPVHLSKRQAATLAVPGSVGSLGVDFGLHMGNLETYKNLSKSKPEITLQLIYNLPTMDGSSNNYQNYDPGSGKLLTIKGTSLNNGVSMDDYNVTIGSGSCRMVSLGSNVMECQPPLNKPTALSRDAVLCKNGWLAVLVTLGSNQQYFINCVDYKYDKVALIIGLTVGLSFVPVLIAVMVLTLVRFKRKNKTPNNQRNNSYDDSVFRNTDKDKVKNKTVQRRNVQSISSNRADLLRNTLTEYGIGLANKETGGRSNNESDDISLGEKYSSSINSARKNNDVLYDRDINTAMNRENYQADVMCHSSQTNLSNGHQSTFGKPLNRQQQQQQQQASNMNVGSESGSSFYLGASAGGKIIRQKPYGNFVRPQQRISYTRPRRDEDAFGYESDYKLQSYQQVYQNSAYLLNKKNFDEN